MSALTRMYANSRPMLPSYHRVSVASRRSSANHHCALLHPRSESATVLRGTVTRAMARHAIAGAARSADKRVRGQAARARRGPGRPASSLAFFPSFFPFRTS